MDAQTLALLGLLAWFAPAVVQDVKTMRVSNWITVPAFFAAWPLAVWLHGGEGLALTFVVFAATFAAMPVGFGPADGKMAVATAAVGGVAALLAALAWQLAVFRAAAFRPALAHVLGGYVDEKGRAHVPGAPWWWLGLATVFVWYVTKGGGM